MKKNLLVLLFSIIFVRVNAARISGLVTDENGKPLSYASVLIKGTTSGTTANNDGKYFLNLQPGNYTIVAQYVGYAAQEKTIHVSNRNMELDFTLSPQQLTLSAVTVRSGAEDPAYAIIRNAIKKRKDYEAPLDSFTCEAYIKTLVKTRKIPDKIFGQKIDKNQRKEMGVDSVGRGIVYLSESLTKIAYKKPGKIKLEVVSGRESGSKGYGVNFPAFIDFYNNNVNVIASQFARRGFVSPIADDALSFYHYHYLGSFFENGREINKIEVIPIRTYEPLFTGTIDITENDWRIHSLDLILTKTAQLELLDTIQIKQIHVPVSDSVWRIKDQVVYFSINFFGVKAYGNYINVYNKYDITPSFPKKYFNNVIVLYDSAVINKTKAYWDSMRPIPLENDERKDYFVKDSIYRDKMDSAFSKHYRDSLRKGQGRVTAMDILVSGFSRSNYNPDKLTIVQWKPLITQLEYNTVEGVVVQAEANIRRSFHKLKKQIDFTPHIRYGFSNAHLNAWGVLRLYKKSFVLDEREPDDYSKSTWTISGGSRVSQFNKDAPITPASNSFTTLLMNNNYMKLYQNYFGELNYRSRSENGFTYSLDFLYEDRLPLENTTNFSIIKYNPQLFTANYPTEKIPSQFTRYQAVVASLSLKYRPGLKFIQFPHSKMPVGSKYPTFELQYEKGFPDILGSAEDFDKWKFAVYDDINLKLKGRLRYRIAIGGFLNNKSVLIQDYQHFNGNLALFAGEYMNSFQAAPYYANSTTASFYLIAHLEHHFNGFLTNKIPLFRKFNWHLVAGANTFYVNNTNKYFEFFAGFDNIFKVLRVDVITSHLNGYHQPLAFKIGLGGLLGDRIFAGK